MRKKKIYLDTSVISYLRQEDAPEKMAETLEFWEILKMGKYDVYMSDVVAGELSACPEPRHTELVDLLEEILYTEIKVIGSDEMADLSEVIAAQHILPNKSGNDRLHIAAAMFSGCHVVVSWNFKHLVNIRTIDGVRVIAALNNLSPVDICSPTMLLERSDSDG
jgi:predicted nucleic acid-binding protein